MAANKIIIFVFVIGAFVAGVYFKDDIVKFYNGFGRGLQNIQEINIGSVVSQVSKEVLSPSPLNIGGAENKVVLLQSKIILETNLQRQENGSLPALSENTQLDDAAAAKASDMFANQYFEHVSPSGVDPGKLVQGFGYNYIVAGENLILGNFSSEKEILQDWMNSPGHRANILNTRYAEMGAAIVKGTYNGQVVWIGVQEFGLPLSACTQPGAALKDQIDFDNAQISSLVSEIDNKKNEIDASGGGSPSYEQMINDYNNMVDQYNSLAMTTKNIVAQYNGQVDSFNNCVSGK